MYTVNIYYFNYTTSVSLLSFPTHFSQFLPPFFNSFLPPFSLFLLYFSQFLLCFSHCWTILSVSYYFFQFLHPFPLYRSFSSFPNLTCSLFTSSCPVSQLLVLFSQFLFPSCFHFPCLSVPSGPLLFTFQFLLLFVQLMSFLLCRSCLLFSVLISFAHFLFALLHFLSSYSPIPLSFHPVPVCVLLVLSLYLMLPCFFVYWDEIDCLQSAFSLKIRLVLS